MRITSEQVTFNRFQNFTPITQNRFFLGMHFVVSFRNKSTFIDEKITQNICNL